MAASEQLILDELHDLPKERWGDVLTFIRCLRMDSRSAVDQPVVSGADLVGSELIGIWSDRTDIADSREFARQLRHQAEHRRGNSDAAGH